MKRKILALLTAIFCFAQMLCAVSAAVAEGGSDPVGSYLDYTVTSPDRSIAAYIGLDKNGVIKYTVQKDGRTVILESVIGIAEKNSNFADSLSLVEFRDLGETDENYSIKVSKKDIIRNYYNSAEMIVSDKSGNQMTVSLRCYDDGFAFRYIIGDENSGKFTFTDENSTFNLNGEWTAWVPEWYSNNYEHLTVAKAASELAGSDAFKNLNMPVLYETDSGDFVYLSEAAYTGDYTGCVLRPSNAGEVTSLKLNFTPSQTSPVVTRGGVFESPWRYAVIGGLAEVIENTMAENLSDDPDPDIDYSFAQSGSVSWSWVSQSDQQGAQHDTDTIKEYIDLAAEMGWEYYLLDEGWQKSKNPPEFYDNFTEIMEYATSKNVKILVWVHKDDIDTDAERQLRFKKWADAGIAGIKCDFFDNENQEHLQLFEKIYKESAELGLVINMHGSNKSTGEVRTYPNVLTREAIRGQEYGDVTARDFVYLGFTRLASGVADITERIRPRRDAATAGFQIALSYITLSGLHTMGDSKENYETMATGELLQKFPTSWDDTKFIDGYPGEYISLARKSGDDWYASAMSVEARRLDMKLDFLGEGRYIAIIYNDGDNYDDITMSAAEVTSKDTLPLDIMRGGGFAVHFMKLSGEAIKGVDRIELSTDKADVEIGRSVSLKAETEKTEEALYDVVWVSSNERVVSVDSSGKITGKALGKATVKAYSVANPEIYDTAEVYVTFVQNEINDSDWTIINRIDDNLTANKDGSLTLYLTDGDPGRDDRLNNRFSMTPKDDDFTVTVKVNSAFTGNYQTVALFAMKDTDNLVATMRRYHDGLKNNYGLQSGNCFEALQYDGDYYEPSVDDLQRIGDAYLKLERKGDTYISSYSYDNENWTVIAENTAPDGMAGQPGSGLTVGVYTTTGVGGSASASISDFTYQGEGDAEPVTYQFTRAIDYTKRIIAGDADGNGEVNVSDMLTLKNFIMNGTGWDDKQFYASDIDGNYVLNVSDILSIKNIIMNS